MQKSLHVFVCSTYRDLVNERNAVMDGMENLSNQFPNLTYFCPRSIQPLEVCKSEIAHSDVLVLILGHLQGVMAPGLDISHGEAEYLEGIAQNKTVLVYFRDEKVGLYPIHFERDKNRILLLKNFKEKLSQNQSPKIFKDLTSLVKMISEDVSEIANERGLNVLVGAKTSRYKSRSPLTRSVPILSGTQLLPPSTPDPQTQTIPIYQKALATPFQRRKSTSGNMGKYILAGIILVGVAGFSIAKYSKHSQSPTTMGVAASDPSTPNSLPVTPGESQITATANPNGGQGLSAPLVAVPQQNLAPVKSTSTVIMMDDNDSIKAFMGKAANGTAAEQFRLGEMYALGKDVKQNDSLAIKWFKKSAEKGNADAEYQLGLIYRAGKGVSKNSYLSARWFEMAASQGNAKAQVKIGQMYQVGKGVRKNDATAFKWFLKAADQKEPEAEKIIATMKAN